MKTKFVKVVFVGLAAVASLTWSCTSTSRAADAGEYIPTGLTPAQVEAKADAILDKMSLREKIHLLAGNGSMCTRKVRSLHIPRLNMSDASIGVRVYGPSTAYPASVCLAATWNPKLAYHEGRALGSDARARGVNIILGPGMCITREPQCGRNFEYVGEDPYLAAQLVAPWIRGLQSQDVAACAKHFAGNEQETHRYAGRTFSGGINTIITRRALQEIYLPPFRAAVRQGHVWTIMAAYNKLNGYQCTANRYLLTDVLRHQWGFKGVLMSDWGATHATLGPMAAGMDLEMPNNQYYNYQTIKPLVKSKQITIHEINQHVRRLLRMMIAMGFTRKRVEDQKIPLNNPKSAAVAFKVAAEGTVLLKNKDGLLPLHRSTVHTIAVIGPMATPAVWCGGGSAYAPSIVNPVSMLAAIRKAAGPQVRVIRIPFNAKLARFWGLGTYTTPGGKPGLRAEYFANDRLAGKPVLTRVDQRIGFNWGQFFPIAAPDAKFSVLWTGNIKPETSGVYLFTAAAYGPCRVYLNGRRIIKIRYRIRQTNSPFTHKLTGLRLQAGKVYHLRVEYFNRNWNAQMEFGYLPEGHELLTASEKKNIKHADVVIACMGYGPNVEHEGVDHTYHLWAPQDQYLREAAGLNPHTIVVLNAGAEVGMAPWIHRIAGLVDAWYPGENGNTAVADILFGKIDPSGRLPDSFGKHWRDDAAYGHFPGHDGQVNFAEGIYVGYRWFDKRHIQPRFCFGDGLSYTTFSFGNLTVTSHGHGKNRVIEVAAPVTNTGKMVGAEVVQLYVRPMEDRVNRCVQTLRAFARVNLAPGQTKTAHLRLHWKDFAFYDSARNTWKVPAGQYQIAVGSSSRDTPVTATIRIRE